MKRSKEESNDRADRALKLIEQGIAPGIVAQRFGVAPSTVNWMVNKARARREKEAPQS